MDSWIALGGRLWCRRLVMNGFKVERTVFTANVAPLAHLLNPFMTPNRGSLLICQRFPERVKEQAEVYF
jgi:hypothetical protein